MPSIGSIGHLLTGLWLMSEVAAAWWLMAQMSSSQLPSNYCNAMPGLSRRQRHLCYQNPDATRALHTGLQEALSECPAQFQHERWNCSLGFPSNYGHALQKVGSREAAYVYSLSAGGASHAIAKACAQGIITDCGCGDMSTVSRTRRRVESTIPYHYQHGIPLERGGTEVGEQGAYINYKDYPSEVIGSNGYTHYSNSPQQASSSYASQSPILPASSASPKDFTWAGCSDNVKYGNEFSRKFIDATERQARGSRMEARARMNLHNNRVGRKVLAANQRRQCKCHGVSGSCVTKTCWLSVPSFDEFATILKRKYQRAQRVTVAPEGSELVVVHSGREAGVNRGRNTSGIEAPKPHSRSGRNPRTGESTRRTKSPTPANKGELVYLDPSPDYCVSDQANEVSGTSGRECFSVQECSELCCGRGWNTQREWRQEPCKCKFIWCCDVKCETCVREVERHFCK